nr:hypothetical protein CFP56_18778 [Quercus suber]
MCRNSKNRTFKSSKNRTFKSSNRTLKTTSQPSNGPERVGQNRRLDSSRLAVGVAGFVVAPGFVGTWVHRRGACLLVGCSSVLLVDGSFASFMLTTEA